MNALWRSVLVACAVVLVGVSLGPGLSLARARLMAAGPLVTSLTVNDSANAGSWSVQSNLQAGEVAYGDRTYAWTSVPAGLAGDTWVRTAAASKTVTANPLASFTLSQAATVSVGVDTRLGRLSWVDASWVDTGAQMVSDDASTAHFELFQKPFAAGSVALGPNAGSGSSYLMYVVVLTPTGGTPSPTPTPTGGGPTIGGLSVNDSANAGSWSIQSNLQAGATAFGDRAYTWTSVPSALLGDPWIRTAAASKTVTTNPLATFSLGVAGVVSVGVDTRLGRLSWIDSSWSDSGTQLVSNDSSSAHFEVFQKSFAAGTVTLGPNAGSGSTYLMYVVAVTPSGGIPSPTPTPSGTPTPTGSPTPTPTPTPSSGCLHNGPVPGKPPGCNFDLSVWSLQLPIGQPGSPTTISNSQLEAGFTDQFFFTGSDGAMDFVDPGVNCVTTPNSTHCRTELREVNPDGSDAAWSASGTNTLSATLVVTDARGAPVVGQVHLDPAISVRPLVELFYTTSGDLVAGVEQCNAGGCETRTTVGHAAPGTKFSYVINYSQNKLSITVNGTTTQLSSPILGEGGYFKAGDYGQSPTNAAVNFTALKIVHA